MKVLSITTLFPNKAQPVHAIFVYRRLQYLARRCEVQVIAPIPYFPFTRWIKKFEYRHRIPMADNYENIQVRYPRYLSIPAILKPLDGFFLLLAVWWSARKIRKNFEFDLIDAHLAFPDGFAGIFLSRRWKKPVSITLRGHDVNVLPTDQFPVRKRQIQFALKNADLVIGVAEALRREAIKLGADPEKSATISNGVDRNIFYPMPRSRARQKLGLPLDRPIILSVGRIVENKGYHLIIEALHLMQKSGTENPARNPLLVVVGGTADEALYPARLHETIAHLKMENQVLLAGPQPNETLREWYSAADIYCLASETEGWANVLLESLACATPVVATNVWGTPEVICSNDYGILVERSPESIAEGIYQALNKSWDPQKMIDYAASQSWEIVAEKIDRAFSKILG